LENQRHGFRRAGNAFEAQARDITAAEVAHAQANLHGELASAVQDVQRRLSCEEAQTRHAQATTTRTRMEAEAVVQGERQRIINQAEYHLTMQRQALEQQENQRLREAHQQFAAQESLLINEANQFAQHEHAEVMHLTSELAANQLLAGSISLQLAQLQQFLKQTRDELTVSDTARKLLQLQARNAQQAQTMHSTNMDVRVQELQSVITEVRGENSERVQALRRSDQRHDELNTDMMDLPDRIARGFFGTGITEEHSEFRTEQDDETPITMTQPTPSRPGRAQPSPEETDDAVKTTLQGKEADTIVFEFLTSVGKHRGGRRAFKKKVAGSSRCPQKAFAWISEVEKTNSIEGLQGDDSSETLDAKVAAGLSSILHCELERQITIIEEQMGQQGNMMNGRQIAWMIYQHYKVSETEGALLCFEDLLHVSLKGDNVRAFVNEWEAVIIALKVVPEENIMESLFRRQLEAIMQLKETIALYSLGVTQKGEERSYQCLMSMTKIHLEKRRLDKHREDLDSKRRRSYASAAKGERKGGGKGGGKRGRSPTPKARTGDCRQFLNNEGKCSRGDGCPWSHDWENSKPPPGTTLWLSAQLLLLVSRRKAVPRGALPRLGNPTNLRVSNSSKGSAKKGKDYELWHPPRCIVFKQGKCDAGKKGVFLHDKTASPATPPSPQRQAEPKTQAKPKPKPKATADGRLFAIMLSTIAQGLTIVPPSIELPIAGGFYERPDFLKVDNHNGHADNTPKHVHFPNYLDARIRHREKTPSLGIIQRTDKSDNINRCSLDPDPEAQEMNDNYDHKCAWDLNKQVYPRKVRCNQEEIESFFPWPHGDRKGDRGIDLPSVKRQKVLPRYPHEDLHRR